MTDLTKTAIIKSKDAPKRVLYCVVLEPDTTDLQDDVIDATEIEKVAWTYAVESRTVGYHHAKDAKGNLVTADADVVETFIAPVDFEVEGELIRKGSWVMGIRVNSDELWQTVEAGEIDGLSIGGTGVRTPV